MPPRRTLLTAALAAALLAAPAWAQTSQPAAPPGAVDTASPKAAVKSFVTAQIKGDGPAIRDVLLATTPTEQRMAGAIADLAVSIADLDHALVTKFGQPAVEPLMGDPQDALRANLDKLDRATERVTGDTATVTSSPDTAGAAPPATGGPNNATTPTGAVSPPGSPTAPVSTGDAGASPQDSMTLHKVGGQWKVSVTDLAKGSSPENVQKTLASVDTAVAGYQSVLADLNAGKLTTVDAVGAELNAKMTAGGVAPPAAAGAAGAPPAVPPVPPTK